MAAENQPAETLMGASRCASCGYSLAGLPVGVVCPECGVRSPVNDERALHACSAAYRSSLHSGLGLVIVGAWLVFGVGLVTVALVLSTLLGHAPEWLLRVLIVLRALLLLMACGMTLRGTRRLTAPDVGQSTGRLMARNRRLVTLCVGFSALLVLTGSAIAWHAAGFGPLDHRETLLAQIALGAQQVLWVLTWCVLQGALLAVLGVLASRVPDPPMVQRTGAATGSLAIIGGVELIMLLGPLLTPLVITPDGRKLRGHLRSIDAESA